MRASEMNDEDLRLALVRLGLDPVLVRDKLAAGERRDLEEFLDSRPAWPPPSEVKAGAA